MSFKLPHKICDPVHGFIRFNEIEKKIIDSVTFQRLRYIRQMGVSYLIYPGANHSRFEHSLGVMELASRIYDTLLYHHSQNPYGDSADIPTTEEEIIYWRQILRFAALCHDMGHLPFSHTAEEVLLPGGGHEKMTREMIEGAEIASLLHTFSPRAKEDVIALALSENQGLSPWKKMLSQIITDDNFGADRIDYLRRDSHYTGVGYGLFDYHQLIDSLRIIPEGKKLTIGISQSGLQSVESLWIARYFMYCRVYHLPKARIFTKHMKRFMLNHYAKNGFPSTLEGYLEEMDHKVLNGVSLAASSGDFDALALLKKGESFIEVPLKGLTIPLEELQSRFKEDLFVDHPAQKKDLEDRRTFWVACPDGTILSSLEASDFLRGIPLGSLNPGVYIHPKEHSNLLNFIKK